MPEREDLWQALLQTGESLASEEDYEHGYKREVRSDLRKYLVFRVGREHYGLPIEQIEEIRPRLLATFVPRTASFVLGIGNVRGKVIPIIDLGERLGIGRSTSGPRSRVLIGKQDEELTGLLVDEVLEVVTIGPEALEDAPGAISSTRADFIAALSRFSDKVLVILQLAAVLASQDFLQRNGSARRRA